MKECVTNKKSLLLLRNRIIQGAADPAPTRSCASHGQASSVDYDDVVEEIDICKEKRAQVGLLL